MARGIFISYRRADRPIICDRIYERLATNFGKDAVFKDIDNIPRGQKFRPIVEKAIQRAGVELVIIGPDWLDAKDERGGRRLDNEDDLVRVEIETALKNHVHVIPLTVDGAAMPKSHDLPTGIRELVEFNGRPVRATDPDFSTDIERVMHDVEAYVPRPRQPAAPPPPPPVAASTSAPPWSQSAPVRVATKLPTPGSTGRGLRWFYAVIGLIIVGVLIAAIGAQFFPKLVTGAPPRGVTNTMILAPVVAKLQQCASEAVASPVNCPQSDSSDIALNQYASGIVWKLHGDPTTGARISYAGQNQWSVLGAFVMTVKWTNSGSPSLDLLKQGYQATVKWDGHQTSLAAAITGSDAPDPSVQLPRPTSATDAAVQQAGRALFSMCATVTTLTPPLTCPQPSDTLGLPSSVRYAFHPDPITGATINYDSGSGVAHLVGNYAMTITSDSGSGPQTTTQNGNYDASLTVDSGVLTVIYVAYS